MMTMVSKNTHVSFHPTGDAFTGERGRRCGSQTRRKHFIAEWVELRSDLEREDWPDRAAVAWRGGVRAEVG